METRESYKWRSKSPGESRERKLSRRILLAGVLGRPLIRADAPEISSFDLSLLYEPIVPADLFFVRNHYPMPDAAAAGWKLAVTGAVAAPVEIPIEELSTAKAVTLGLTLECAENPVGGGLISHAEWSGLNISWILERAKPASDARYVRFLGADGFSRTIPMAKAMQGDSLLAFRMNGERLPASHGYPLRAVIGGWYGMTSVKWLRTLEVLQDFQESPATGGAYRRHTKSLLGTRAGEPVTAVKVKSVFSRPTDGAILQGRQFILRGAAWAGENRIRRLEVSVDGQKTWQPAQFSGEASRYSWILWSYNWKIPRPGAYELAVRAEDDEGQQQPAERAGDRADSYEMNAWQRIAVTVV